MSQLPRPHSLRRTAVHGASSPLPTILAKVASSDRKQPLRLGGANQSSCPETAVQTMVGGGREADIPPGRFTHASHLLRQLVESWRSRRDESKPHAPAPRSPASRRFDCQQVGCGRISLPREPPGTEDHVQRAGNPENVGQRCRAGNKQIGQAAADSGRRKCRAVAVCSSPLSGCCSR
jgi:hypothetical protein